MVKRPRGRSIAAILERSLSAPDRSALRKVGALARAGREASFVVGGTVRDALLGREARDLDVVLEGDAGTFARRLTEAYGGCAVVHQRFGTAAWQPQDGPRIDLASTRSETYAKPGALPTVAAGTIREDLFRRDFTVNALAVELTPSGFGRLLDFFGGHEDLRQRSIRILHPRSFVDDPTRAIRAARFTAELGFTIERETDGLIGAAIDAQLFDHLSPVRLRREFARALGGARPVDATRAIVGLRLFDVLGADLAPDRAGWTRIQRAEEILAWYGSNFPSEPVPRWAIVLAVLLRQLTPASGRAVIGRLAPVRAERELLETGAARAQAIVSRFPARGRFRASGIHAAARGERTEVILLASVLTGRASIRGALAKYLIELRNIRTSITGRDLILAGIAAGPRVARGLQAALHAKLDGRRVDPAEELRVALAAARGA